MPSAFLKSKSKIGLIIESAITSLLHIPSIVITADVVLLSEFKIISLTVKSAEFANADFSEDKFSFNELYILSPILGFTKLSQLFRNLYIITFIANISNGDKMIISIIRTLLLYAFVILAIRLMGKRQISDMQPSELVVTLIVSDIAAIPMSNTSQPLLSGIIPVLVLIACEIIASIIMLKTEIPRSYLRFAHNRNRGRKTDAKRNETA